MPFLPFLGYKPNQTRLIKSNASHEIGIEDKQKKVKGRWRWRRPKISQEHLSSAFKSLRFYVIHLISKFPQKVKSNCERLDMSYVVGVKVEIDSHKAVTDHTQKKQEWQKDHL